ncbi:hypothetical protein D8M24_11545, partial [Corynebacterium propinquum]
FQPTVARRGDFQRWGFGFAAIHSEYSSRVLLLFPAPVTNVGNSALRYWRVLLTNRSGTRTQRIMLLYTNKANNVFDQLHKR